MSKLQKLIQELCPYGVEYKPLGDKDVSIMQRGTSLTKKDSIEGIYPVISGGKVPAFYCNQFNREGETITVAGSGAGAGYVQYWNEPIFVCDAFSIKGIGDVYTKYLYYCLTNLQEKIYATKKGGGVPHVHIASIENFLVPIPPLQVQKEIVHILDDFTNLAAELQAELQARKDQYEYYRNKLLTFDKPTGGGRKRPNVIWMKMSEVCEIKSGKNKSKSSIGTFPVYGSTGIIAFSDNYAYSETQILVARVGANAGYIHIATGKHDVSDNTLIINPQQWISLKFMFHILINLNLNRFTKGGGQPLITASDIKKLSIPIPPLSEQQRIASILDKFETLVNDLSQGLPAEIAAVQEQYEYYRNKLLTFKRAA